MIIIFYKNYKNAASLFYSYTNYSALNLSMKFRNIPQDPQVIFLWLHVAKNYHESRMAEVIHLCW